MPARTEAAKCLQSSVLLLARPRRLALSVTALSGIGAAYLFTRPQSTLVKPTNPTRSATPHTSSLSTMAPRYKVTPYSPPSSALPPLNPSDFKRVDETDDAHFYVDSRFVTHIDDNAIDSLTQYYDSVIPTTPTNSKPPIVLDLCSSWISHYPSRVQKQVEEGKLEVLGQGMNPAELKKNPNFLPGVKTNPKRWAVYDLNTEPSVEKPLAAMGVDTSKHKVSVTTLTVSVDYLTQPHAVLASLLEATAPGGSVHLAVSNRCFPTKAVRRWMHADEDTRLKMCCEDLYRAGWQSIEIVEVTNGSAPDDTEEAGSQGSGLKSLMAAVGFKSSGDPLWVVRGSKSAA